MKLTATDVAASIQKGVFKPHIYLTNVCLSYFQNAAGYVARNTNCIRNIWRRRTPEKMRSSRNRRRSSQIKIRLSQT